MPIAALATKYVVTALATAAVLDEMSHLGYVWLKCAALWPVLFFRESFDIGKLQWREIVVTLGLFL